MNTSRSKLLEDDSILKRDATSAASVQSSPVLPCVRSEDLFGIDREIMIEHAGAQYRLRLTRANKLILTK